MVDQRRDISRHSGRYTAFTAAPAWAEYPQLTNTLLRAPTAACDGFKRGALLAAKRKVQSRV